METLVVLDGVVGTLEEEEENEEEDEDEEEEGVEGVGILMRMELARASALFLCFASMEDSWRRRAVRSFEYLSLSVGFNIYAL
jgi:hypothetical protein